MALYGANKTTTPQALPNKKDCKIDLSEPRSAFLNNRAMTIFSYRPKLRPRWFVLQMTVQAK